MRISRLILTVAVAYVAVAIFTRVREASGAYGCQCDEDCWCKRPGLGLFRWVFPGGHRIGWERAMGAE